MRLHAGQRAGLAAPLWRGAHAVLKGMGVRLALANHAQRTAPLPPQEIGSIGRLGGRRRGKAGAAAGGPEGRVSLGAMLKSPVQSLMSMRFMVRGALCRCWCECVRDRVRRSSSG